MQKSICFEQEQHLLPQKRKPLATEPASRKRARNTCIPQIETRRWHCNGRTKTYINHKQCDGDWTECPNKDCENFIMWDAKNNLKCQRCKSKGLEMKLSDNKSPNLRWRWVRCAAENCKAMYMHNRGNRLKRSADKCGLLESAAKKYGSVSLWLIYYSCNRILNIFNIVLQVYVYYSSGRLLQLYQRIIN